MRLVESDFLWQAHKLIPDRVCFCAHTDENVLLITKHVVVLLLSVVCISSAPSEHESAQVLGGVHWLSVCQGLPRGGDKYT